MKLAYLDRIVENIDNDQSHNSIDKLVVQMKKTIEENTHKIVIDQREIELKEQQDNDFEFKDAFDRSFYGKVAV